MEPQADALAAGLLTTDQAAERLGVTRGRVLQYLRDGRFPGAGRLGPAWIIPEAAVAAFERRKTGRPATATRKQQQAGDAAAPASSGQE